MSLAGSKTFFIRAELLNSLLTAVIVLAPCFVLPGCSREEQPEPDEAVQTEKAFDESSANLDRDSMLAPEERTREKAFGGVINVRMPYDPPTLNNMTRQDGYSQSVCKYIYPRLLEIEADSLELIPFTAESLPDVSEDKLVCTWCLRKGLRWHDFEESGAYVTTRDVRFSFDVMKDPASGAARVEADFKHLIDVRVIDDHRFQAVYDKRSVDAGYKMGHDFRRLPAHILDSVPHKEIASHPIGRKPVGYGPFSFHHWESDQEILLNRNDMNRDIFPEKFRPYVDGLRWRSVPDADMVTTRFMRGEIDICVLVPDDWKHRTRTPEFEKIATRHMYFLPFWTYIAWNNESGIFRDPLVRRAMTHMVRRKEILQSHIHGLGKVITGPLFYYSRAYDRSVEPFCFDARESVRLLEEAGWEDHDGDGILDKKIDDKQRNFEFELYSLPFRTQYQEALATALKEDLRKIGVKMNLRQMERSAFADKLNECAFEAFTWGFRTYHLFEDPYGIWHSSQARQGTNNRVFYKNSRADKLLEGARLEFDEEKRFALLREFHRIIHKDQPFTFLYSLASSVAINKRWYNVKIHKTGVFFYEWWLPPENRKPSDELPR